MGSPHITDTSRFAETTAIASPAIEQSSNEANSLGSRSMHASMTDSRNGANDTNYMTTATVAGKEIFIQAAPKEQDPAKFEQAMDRYTRNMSAESKKLFGDALSAAVRGDTITMAKSLLPADGHADAEAQAAFARAMKDAGITVKFDSNNKMTLSTSDGRGIQLSRNGETISTAGVNVRANGRADEIGGPLGEVIAHSSIRHIQDNVQNSVYGNSSNSNQRRGRSQSG